jgi:tetratricopeptide (TPR) repeat protein
MRDDASVAGVPKDFTHRYLPWVVAAVGLVVYLVTLNRWPSFGGLPMLARVAGWDWRPTLYGPLYFLATYPIRWLPDAWQLIGLSLFSAACSALSLALLARSVSLLPHDRTRDQRGLEGSDYSLLSIGSAWLPPVLAVLVCGLQLTFWENAVFATAEALDLLIFAYVIRCLLEYRLDQRESWLFKTAFVYGLGMTTNLALVGFLPGLLLALVWIKQRGFFRWQFLLRMAVLGLAGLSLHVLLPAINSVSDIMDRSFWELLRGNLGFQKSILLGVPRYLILLMGLTSLVPVFFMGIRWPAHFGDISSAGNYLTRVMTHVIHLIFLAACIYVAFDPPFSPRKLAGGMFAYLPFYYLGALAVGYCSGYFLLVFGAKPSSKTRVWQKPSPLRQALNYALVALVWVALGAVPVGLVYQNYPLLRVANARYLGALSEASARQLPAQSAIVLSDDPFRLYALQAALNQIGAGDKHLLLDTKSLAQVPYHLWLQSKYPQWPKLPPEHPRKGEVDAGLLVTMLKDLTRDRDVYYLQPTFGYYLEYFYLKPRKALYQLVPYPANSLSGPALTRAELTENAEFWKQFKSAELGLLIKAVVPEKPTQVRRSATKIRRDISPLTLFVGSMFSRAFDYLGVELQRAGDIRTAGEFFDSALELNPDNPAAFINQGYNAVLRGQRKAIDPKDEGVKRRLAGYGGNWDAVWNTMLSLNGPVDEPNTCFLLAKTFQKGGNHRQAAQLLERVVALNPEERGFRLELANGYVQARMPDKALEVVASVRAGAKTNALDAAEDIALTQVEAWAQTAKSDLPVAEKLLSAAQQKYPLMPGPFATMAEIYLTVGRAKDAIAVLTRQLQLQTNHVNAMVNLGAVLMREGELEAAIPRLDRALTLQPQNSAARLNRAVGHLNLNHLDAAQKDYEQLEVTMTKVVPAVYYGLGEIYTQKKQRKRAIECYEKYLKLALANTPEAKYVADRLDALRRGRL